MKQFLILAFVVVCFIQNTSISQAQQLSLTPSNYNGYNISCFGGNNGSIDLTIAGGVAPFTILWSNTATTEDISNLRAGYYRVTVEDADTQTPPVVAEITLTEPSAIGITAESYRFPNNYNISVYGACNGSIDITPSNGVSPFTYVWSDGITTQDRGTLCANSYKVTVTDNNGCSILSESIGLTQPDRSDWQMTGNLATDPTTNFIGTSDNVDIVFRTNLVERMRISNSGQLSLSSLTGNGNRYIQASPNGSIMAAPGVPWETHGNDNIDDQVDYIGTINAADFIISTNAAPRIFVKSTGLVGIGIQNPVRDFEVNGISRFGDALTGMFIETKYDNILNFIELDSYGLSNGLKINYNSGENVQILTNTSGGSFEVGHNTFLSTISGSVSIGTTNSQAGYKLLVEGGKAGFREVYVTLNGVWPDYVFSNDYKLATFSELKESIMAIGHLPGMPDSEEIKTNGQNIGEIQRLQQEKIEELYLYIIELNEKILELESVISK